jgi:hypothetical protein
MTDDESKGKRAARRTVFIGMAVSAVSAAALVLPILLGPKIGRFVAAGAIIGLFIGISVMLNGTIDWWRRT